MRAVVAFLLIVVVVAGLIAMTKLGLFARSHSLQNESGAQPSLQGAVTTAEANALLQDWTFPGSLDDTAYSMRTGSLPHGIPGRAGQTYRVLISKAPFGQINDFYHAKYLSGPSPAFPDRPVSAQASGFLPSSEPSSWIKNGVRLQACGYARNTGRYSLFVSISSMEDGKRSRIYLTFAPVKPLLSH